MTRSARSIYVFSIYLFILGPVLLLVPNRLLALVRIPETNEVWIRVVGMLVLIVAYYYLQAARNGLRSFFAATVVGRSAVLFFFVAFVLFDLAPPVLVVFGLVDAAGAAWTVLSLRAEGSQ